MGKITVLDQNTINQIAAGEVVERPASVVKELIENAIDAGASAITCEIKEGGIRFIRITDNGAGIDKEEIPVAFLRHATSKIKSVEDLLTIGSLGFRGEALSSISSVAQVELVTKTRNSLIGSRYMIEGGEEQSLTEIGCPDGTTFLVRNLFFNTPARRKFLKTTMTEAGYISDLMERIAISHPEISFKFINNNKTVLHTFGNSQLKDIIYHIYGRSIAAELVEIQNSTGDVSIYGFAGKPIISRGNRNYENYFINGRYIKSNIIGKAIEEAYRPFTMQHKYPFTALHFVIPSERIDVNVHPTKMEVRFTNAQEIYDMTYETLKSALHKANMIPDVALEEEKKEERNIEQKTPEPFERKRLAPTMKPLEPVPNIAFGKPSFLKQAEVKTSHKEATELTKDTELAKLRKVVSNAVKAKIQKEEQKAFEESETITSPVIRETPMNSTNEVIPEMTGLPKIFVAEQKEEKLTDVYQETFITKEEEKKNYQMIGQLFSTYWMVECDQQLYIIDQHAAHEKILYERTIKRLKEKTACDSQHITPPMIVTLNLKETAVMMEHMETLTMLGFEIEPFGGNEYAISAVPADLYGLSGENLFIEFLDNMVSEIPKGTPDVILEKIASMSCKAAVKGNQKLSVIEAKSLIEQLLSLENPFHCPHGRPVIVSMTKYELEKKFKRIV